MRKIIGVTVGTPTSIGKIKEEIKPVGKAGTGEYAELFNDASEASGRFSHAEGKDTKATATAAHAEGDGSDATGYYSHAEGEYTHANGTASHAEGKQTEAAAAYQHVQGKFNIPDTTSAHIVGNGEHLGAKSNAHTLDWDGNAWFAGDVYVGSTSGKNKDEGSVKLQRAITGTVGQFVVIGEDGNPVAASLTDVSEVGL